MKLSGCLFYGLSQFSQPLARISHLMYKKEKSSPFYDQRRLHRVQEQIHLKSQTTNP